MAILAGVFQFGVYLGISFFAFLTFVFAIMLFFTIWRNLKKEGDKKKNAINKIVKKYVS